jgi:aspartate aminotransferase
MDWEGVVVTAGAKQSLFNATFSLFGPGDEVLIAAPFWTTYPDQVLLARAEPRPVFGPEEDSFKISPADLDEVVTSATRGLIINSPSNPSGAVYKLDELEALARWCKSRGIWLISDEIYRDIHHDDDSPAPGILDLDEDALGDFVLIDGASKGYAMTGWRIGFSWTTPEVAKKFTALQSQLTSNAATPSQMAAVAAYSQTEAAAASHESMGAAFRRRRDLVVARMADSLPGVPFVRPEGAFYIYFRVDGLFDERITSATDWCAALLEQHGVALVPGAAFGDDRWVRLSFATSDEVLVDAFDRIAAMVGAGSAA